MAYLRNKEFLKAFGEHLRLTRRSRRISQAQLAHDCDMEISQISRMERGLLNTSISNIYQISLALGIHHRELLDFNLTAKKKKPS